MDTAPNEDEDERGLGGRTSPRPPTSATTAVPGKPAMQSPTRAPTKTGEEAEGMDVAPSTVAPMPMTTPTTTTTTRTPPMRTPTPTAITTTATRETGTAGAGPATAPPPPTSSVGRAWQVLRHPFRALTAQPETTTSLPAVVLREPEYEPDDAGNVRLKLDLTLLVAQIVAATRVSQRGPVPSYYMYTVELQYYDFRWTVARRFRDFLRLHTRLKLHQLSAGKDGGSKRLPSFPYFIRTRTSTGSGQLTPRSNLSHEMTRRRSLANSASSVDDHDLDHEPRPPDATAASAAGHSPLPPDVLAPHEEVDGPDVFRHAQSRLEWYIAQLLAAALDAKAKRLVLEFFQLGKASFMPAMGPKPFETTISKRPGGRHFERYNWRVFSLFVDLAYLVQHSYNRKWLVVRSNHLAYYGGPDESVVQEVMLLDRYTQLALGAKQTGSARVLRMANGYRELVFRLPTDRLAIQLADIINYELKHESAWCQPHLYESYAPVRASQAAQFLVDGAEYFAAVADALEDSRHTIYLADWWLSPEVYLKRPPHRFQDFRLDRLLQRKASEGVKVFVMVYKEVPTTLPNDSYHTKTTLKSLHANIHVVRHPDHATVRGTLYWAHHEKLVVVDNRVAFLGGLDLCFGRYDTPEHPTTDLPVIRAASEAAAPAGTPSTAEPARPADRTSMSSSHVREELRAMPSSTSELLGPSTEGGASSIDLSVSAPPSGRDSSIEIISKQTVFPGKDYSNPYVRDFFRVDQHAQDSVDRNSVPRMPWHDVGVCLHGQAARDVAWHFVQRWNFAKVDKAKTEPGIPFLLPVADSDVGMPLPSPGLSTTCQTQLLRSCGRWSSGIDTEASVYKAYLHAIETAEHFIYLENQFFVTTAADPVEDGGPTTLVLNRIGHALFRRIQRAHAAGTPFRVIVVLPLMPAFSGMPDDASAASLRIVMQRQFDSISRGPTSLLGRLRLQGIDPTKYIGFFSLRSWAALDSLQTTVLYVHSKLLIVDDRIAIIGSANLNDRSMVGMRDSEIAVRVADTDTVATTMHGKPWQASRFAHAMRVYAVLAPRALFQEHLGIAHGDAAAAALLDPGLETAYADLWLARAKRNSDIYRAVFHCIPDDSVRTWADYRAFLSTKPPERAQARAMLEEVRGHVVLFQTEFLADVDLLAGNVGATENLVAHEVFL